jgi:hypothetical protein
MKFFCSVDPEQIEIFTSVFKFKEKNYLHNKTDKNKEYKAVVTKGFYVFDI